MIPYRDRQRRTLIAATRHVEWQRGLNERIEKTRRKREEEEAKRKREKAARLQT